MNEKIMIQKEVLPNEYILNANHRLKIFYE